MEQDQANNYALRLLSIRPRGARELADRLRKKGAEEGTIEAVIAGLGSAGLVDDNKFARLWIESRMSLKPMGASRLRSELIAKGIDRDIIDSVLSTFKDEMDEEDAALRLAQKKLRLLRGLDTKTARRRLAGFLSRRGFSAATVAATLRRLVRASNEDDPSEGPA